MKNKEGIANGVKTVSIAVAVIVLAPVLITMGFKGIKIEHASGYVLLGFGIIAAIIGILLLAKGIKHFLDYWFEQ